MKDWKYETWKYIYEAGQTEMPFRACVILKRQGKEPDDKIFHELIKLLGDERKNFLALIEECRLHHSPPLMTPENPIQ